MDLWRKTLGSIEISDKGIQYCRALYEGSIQGSDQHIFFSVKGQIVHILDFVGHMVSAL